MSGLSPEMEEIAGLVSAICQQGSSPDTRKAAEQRLMQLQRDASKWRFHLDLLFYLDDNCVFFVAQGLYHFVWAHWRVLPADDRDFLTSAVTRVIAQRAGGLSQYARSKVEQVLAAVCALSGSLGPALSLVADPGQPGAEVGLSTLKTVLEEALCDDKRLTPDHRRHLVREAGAVALASVEMACRICAESVQTGSADGPVLFLALDLLKTVIAPLPVGPHLTPQALDVLCALAERAISIPEGSSGGGGSMRSQRHCRSAIAAIEILTEIMGKRYIPRNEQTGADSGVDVLVSLVAKVVLLLQRFKPVCNHVENADVTLPLLEFIRTFAECHLERCCSTPVRSATMEAVVLTFLDELAGISRCLTGVELLLSAAMVWEELVAVPAIRALVMGSDTAVQVALYFLTQSLVSSNEDLEAQCMDMVDELSLTAIGDRDIRALVAGGPSGAGRGGAGAVEGAEQAGCDGSALLALVSALIGEFLESEKFLAELRALVPRLTQEQLEAFTAAAAAAGGRGGDDLSAHALDILTLSRLLPVCASPEETLRRLAEMLSQLVEGGYYRGGRAIVALVLQLSQLLGGICYSCRKGGCYDQQHDVQLASFHATVPLLRCVTSSIQAQAAGADALIGQMQLACGAALLQNVAGMPPTLLSEPVSTESGSAPLGAHVLAVVQQLLGRYVDMPIEVATVLYCTASRISPDVPSAMAGSMAEMSAAVASSGTVVSMSGWSEAQLAYLARTCAALSAVARQHAGADAATRSALLRAVDGLDAMVPILATSACMAVGEVAASGGEARALPLLRNLSIVLSQCTALVMSLVHTFGRKTFGKAACTMLGVVADLLVPRAGRPSVDAVLASVPSGEGIGLFRQLLLLTAAMASSSSAAIASGLSELEVSHRLLLVMVGELSNSAVCAELLGEIIKTGWTLVTCHWPKAGKLPNGSVDLGTQPNFDSIIPAVSTGVQLFVGCLSGQSIPPQDAALAIEGLVQANEKFHFFAADWFQQRFLGTILESTVNAVLSGQLPGREDMLEQLLEMVCTDAGVAVWPVFKEISGKVATAANCNPSIVTQLIAEEEGNAIRKSEADQGISSTASEQTDKGVRTVFSGMKAVLITLSSEMKRCKEPTGFG